MMIEGLNDNSRRQNLLLEFQRLNGVELEVWVEDHRQALLKADDDLSIMIRHLITPLLRRSDPECETWIKPLQKGVALYLLVKDNIPAQVEVLEAIHQYCLANGYPKARRSTRTTDPSDVVLLLPCTPSSSLRIVEEEHLITCMFRSVLLWDLATQEALFAWEESQEGGSIALEQTKHFRSACRDEAAKRQKAAGMLNEGELSDSLPIHRRRLLRRKRRKRRGQGS